MMRADALNLHVYPVRMEMTDMQHIPISHVCDVDDSKSKEILVDGNLFQVCSTEEGESESVIVDEISTEDRELGIVQKSINTNKEKYAIDETDHEEPSVTDNPVINEPRYFNLFWCGKNLLNRIDSTCERACMSTSRDRYYM